MSASKHDRVTGSDPVRSGDLLGIISVTTFCPIIMVAIGQRQLCSRLATVEARTELLAT